MARIGNLSLRAGPRAAEILRDGGLDVASIRILAGASGGPKWLVLSGMDLALARILKHRTTALLCVGSSIGAWRLAALAQQDADAAIRSFEERYIAQSYDRRPHPHEVSAESRRVLNAYIRDQDIPFMLRHPFIRLGFIASRSRWPGSLDGTVPLVSHLMLAFLANTVHRSLLTAFFERTLFRVPDFDTRVLGSGALRPRAVVLTPGNLLDALLASGSIPLVMEGVRHLADTPPGCYRDGGIIDYHMNPPFAVGADDIVFIPHFFERLTPGWFDQHLPWRRATARGLENTVLVAPSADFVASLPGAKVPDRSDFATFSGRDAERMATWRAVARRCRMLGDELEDLFQTPRDRLPILPLHRRLSSKGR